MSLEQQKVRHAQVTEQRFDYAKVHLNHTVSRSRHDGLHLMPMVVC
jgi:hypothetical protein